MKTLRMLMGFCVLSSAMIVGCRQAPRDRCCCSPAYTCYPCQETCTEYAPKVDVKPQEQPKELPKEDKKVEVVPEVVETKVVELPKPVEQPVIQRTRATHLDVRPTKAGRRTFADITAHPCFSHCPEYSWLIGELQYIQSSNTWRLRYSSLDENDKYGGTVTLIETGPMTDYHSGQMVRVEGQMIEASEGDEYPRYRVRSMVAHPVLSASNGPQF